MCTPLVIQKKQRNCVLANDNNLEVLPHIILCLSTRPPQTIGSPGHVTTCFLKFRISKNSVFQDQDFFPKIDKKSSKKITTNDSAKPLPKTKHISTHTQDAHGPSPIPDIHYTVTITWTDI